MSHKATAWAFTHRLPPLEKLVLIVLADRHNGCTGRCDISFLEVAIACGMTSIEADGAIAGLETKRLIIPSEDGVILVGVQ